MEAAVNFNGDLPFSDIKRGARLAEELGYSHIWVGESIHFNHPFPVIAAIAEATNDITIGSGIISYFFNRPLQIKKAFETLLEAYGNRFAITLAPGDMNSLRESGIEPSKPLKRLEETLAFLRRSEKLKGTPIYVGASGPRMIELGSRLADGVLLNYAHPEYVEWALDHIAKDTFIGVYAPALLLPDKKNETAARMAAAFVAAGSNKRFQERFRLTEDVNLIRKILKEKKYGSLKDKQGFLFERFLISGRENEILRRIDDYRKLGVDQVILGSPFTYNLKALKVIARAL